MSDHGLLGDEARDELPDVPEDAFENEPGDGGDSGDRGIEMDGLEDLLGDGAGDIRFDDDESDHPASPSPALGAPPVRQTVSSGEPEGLSGPPPMFESLDEWVHGWLLPVYRRSLDVSNMVFCPQWWRHPEAYLRLDALWKSWEFMRRKPGTGMAVWLRDYCDYHMSVLMREQTGPFKGCAQEAHNTEFSLKPWELQPMPTSRHIARLYDQQGLQHSRPGLQPVQSVQWDGVDQK